MTMPRTRISLQRAAQGLGLTLTLLGSLGCGGGAEKQASPPTPPVQTVPVISSFTATPTTLQSGASTTLTWAVSGAISLSINEGIGTVSGTSRTVTPAATTTYVLTATNATGSSTHQATVTVTATADTQPPSVPINLATSNVTATGLTLTWTAATDNLGVTGYRVFRNGTQVGTPTTTSFAQTGLTPSTAYSYTVAALDAAGNVSPQSAAHSVTTAAPPADTQPPSAPTNLATSNVTATSLTLTWTAATDNLGVTGYRVFRNGTQVGTPNTNSFAQTGLTPSTAYSYAVAALDAAGNVSAQSTARSVTTAAVGADTQAPSVPSGLAAYHINATHLKLSWVTSTDNVGVMGYRIFRNGTQVGTSATNSFKDTGLMASTRYSFTVAAYDAAGNISPQSAARSQVTASTDDTTPPTAPTNLAAIEVQATGLVLTWTASTDSNYVQRYYVYRNGAVVGNSGSPFFGDTGLTASTAYTYTVTAEDSAGNVSQTSAEKRVTTPIHAPTLGTFTATRRTVTQGQATTLNWTVNNATTLTIEPGVGTVTGTSRTLSPSATTTYALTATNAGGSVTRRLIIRVNKPGEVLDDSDGPFRIIEP
ncbi:MAG: fibronectin type III domain-containing protein [Holophaga sp.]|nr:fibronectin type III domain-containing protein [Holophaga sp.]